MRRQGRGVHIPQHELAELEQKAADRILWTAARMEHGLQMKRLRAEQERRTENMNALEALTLLLGAGKDGVTVVDQRGNSTMTPAMNVFRDLERYAIQVPLPGIMPEDVKLDLEEINGEQHLHLRAVNRDPFEKRIAPTDPAGPKMRRGDVPTVGYIVYEYPHTGLERCLGVPSDVNPDKITSTFENGMLTVTMPRETARSLVKPTRSIDIIKKA